MGDKKRVKVLTDTPAVFSVALHCFRKFQYVAEQRWPYTR